MPAHISVLLLLLASEVHRKALVKVLNEAYVPEDNTAPCFENMVTAVLATNQLTFLDDELPPEGRGHVKALHITVKIRERIIAKVLIDIGSALNVFPMSTLDKLRIDQCRHRRKSSIRIFSFFLFIFLDTDPHLASVVCVPLSLFRFEIRVVCVWELVYVCACEHKFGVATNHGKF
jgi:hypothetical protein